MLYCLVDVDSEKEGGETDSGISTIGEAVRDQISEGGKSFNVPEIEFQEYKVKKQDFYVYHKVYLHNWQTARRI